uniref:Ubiquitin carboxyl-terminal hydrolase n=1 Tax=Blastobotrys adeninivorans TaxID=409370 RepID=A0A060T4A7_BLAAD
MSGCKHSQVGSAKRNLLTSYSLAVKLLRDHELVSQMQCQECGSNAFTVPRVCLECSFVGCVEKHGAEHARAQGHNLAVDICEGTEANMYCYSCADYIIDDKFEAITKTDDYAVGTLPPYQATTGLRGFYNMGATCFISVVLQSFVHNPIIRNFYLSGGHDKNECPRGTSGEPCLGCCVDDLFVDFFKTNNSQGFGPIDILVASWKVNRALAGASEQDAHEFFQFILNELHKTHFRSSVMGHLDKGHEGGGEDDITCSCVAHRTFCGQLQSQIQCHECKNITCTVDPMMDLSLDLKSKSNDISLEGCLDRFTEVEKLDIMYYCKNCDKRQSVDKQLCIKKLPVVLSFQLKRFEHAMVKSAVGTKIETPVKFPLYLSMAKYTCDGDSADFPMNYQLFGVVCHQGSINTGHYTCYMKNRLGCWYYFDDAMVTAVDSSTVLAADNAYLLFYMIDNLEGLPAH